MSTTSASCCCKPVEPKSNCSMMFLRSKTIHTTPVFSTPGITIWTKSIVGYTGMGPDGYFHGEDGTTGCTLVRIGDNGYYKNIGIEPKNVIHESKLFGQIPPDSINFYGPPDPRNPPPPKTYIYGCIILPKRFEGITLENSEVDETGNVYYKLVKGPIPDSIKPLVSDVCNVYKRYRPDILDQAAPVVAGTNLEYVQKFKVFYSDSLSTKIKTQNEFIFSFDELPFMPTGSFGSNKDQGCAPCRINWPVGSGQWLCFNSGPKECGGVLYSFYQTIPETVYALNLSLSECEDERGKYISITDTERSGSFNYKKAVISSDAGCPAEIDSCEDEFTRDRYFCGSGGIGGSTDLFNCDPDGGIGKGIASGPYVCQKTPLSLCDGGGGCSEVPCDVFCPEQHYIMEHIIYHSEDMCDACDQFPGTPRCLCSNNARSTRTHAINVSAVENYRPSPLCVGSQTTSCNGASKTGYYCQVSGFSVPPCAGIYQMPYRWVSLFSGCGCGPNYEYVCESADNSYDGYIPILSPCGNARGGNEAADCCCCGGSSDPRVNCDIYRTPPDLGNVVHYKQTSTVSISVNPYLMITYDDRYFDKIKNTGKFVPNFSKYIETYLKTWIERRKRLYPDAEAYKPYFKNPDCKNPAITIPDYFFSKSGPIRGCVLRYDSSRCVYRCKDLPNPDEPCKNTHTIEYGLSRTCSVNRERTDIQELSYSLACSNTYNSNPCWKELSKYWKMKTIDYDGDCGVLKIKVPDGVTFDDCTDVWSWKVLSKAPKRPL